MGRPSVSRGSVVALGFGALGILGIAAIFAGSILSWGRCELFNRPLSVTGLILGGVWTLSLGALGLVSLRRFPWLAALAGLGVVLLAAQARERVGRLLRGEQLRVEMALAPLNAGLSQLKIAELHPLGSLKTSPEYVDSGVYWVYWGGGLLSLGASGRHAFRSQGRRCRFCGANWPRGISPQEAPYCVRCGTRSLQAPVSCTVCHEGIDPGQAFCGRCGTRIEQHRATQVAG